MDDGVHDLAEVVRRDVGGHADGDAGAAVDQQVRDRARAGPCGSCSDSSKFGLHVDGVLVDVGQQLLGQPVQAALGVPVGRGRVAVDAAEVALPVDQQVAHGEILRHAHERVVDGRVAVGMVLADDVADDAGALHVRAWLCVPAALAHGEEDAPVAGLEPVAGVGQRAARR